MAAVFQLQVLMLPVEVLSSRLPGFFSRRSGFFTPGVQQDVADVAAVDVVVAFAVPVVAAAAGVDVGLGPDGR
ncbi:hypothetical protein ACGFYP_34190 [Streptomyces sp. NPDC048370]|uniref:hypothetical protein n=1 Tax=Streptomyces sp. NPDC048370 TaxID=3365540 RepID=UPI00371CF12F